MVKPTLAAQTSNDVSCQISSKSTPNSNICRFTARLSGKGRSGVFVNLCMIKGCFTSKFNGPSMFGCDDPECMKKISSFVHAFISHGVEHNCINDDASLNESAILWLQLQPFALGEALRSALCSRMRLRVKICSGRCSTGRLSGLELVVMLVDVARYERMSRCDKYN